ncbi:hypothetical protein RJT00_10740 [Segatella copri]|uniref:hypothetical protein n=1 Tax=Segatella copri TaxID=165179 RepID=UPI00293B4767|nr:hypothetical protein [Segatella copri]MDV3113832.1 hypothetical protein [Segatella copri]
MKVAFDEHFLEPDDNHQHFYFEHKAISEYVKQQKARAEQKEKAKDENGEKQVIANTLIGKMIDDVSQKLKIGFEQYIMAKEEEISKLKNELAAEKLLSEGVHKENQMLVQNLDKAKAEKQQLAQKLDKVQSEKQQQAHDLEATQAENRQLAYKLYQAQESNKQLAQNREDILKANQQLAQKLDEAQKANQQQSHDLDEAQKANQQLVHDLDEAQAKNKELARGQGEAMDECMILEYKLEEAQAEKQKLNKKLDEARDEISSQDIAIRRMKKEADRKAAAMVADTSEVKEAFAREMIGSGIRFVKDMKTAIDDSQTFKCMGLLTHMTDDCFGKHEPIHRELKDMIQGIFGSREQVAKEQNKPRSNNVRVEEGGVYNAVVHHQDIHPKVDKRDSLPESVQPDSLPEVDLKDSLPRYKRRRLGLEGEDYEWR